MAKRNPLFNNVPPVGRAKKKVKVEAEAGGRQSKAPAPAPQVANTAGAQAQATQGARQQVKRKQNLKRGGLTDDERLRNQNA